MTAISPRHGGDGTHRPPRTSDAFRGALRALHNELDAQLLDPALDGHLGDALLLVAAQARIDGLRAEQLVIAFREIWDGDRPILPREDSSKRDRLRWSLVSQLITGYYANTDGAAAAAG